MDLGTFHAIESSQLALHTTVHQPNLNKIDRTHQMLIVFPSSFAQHNLFCDIVGNLIRIILCLFMISALQMMMIEFTEWKKKKQIKKHRSTEM